MSIFNVNFSQLWNDITPPVLQKPIQQTWGTSLLQPLQYLRDLVFNDYANGSPYPVYDAASAYTTNDRVVYSGRAVYESVSGSTGVDPNNIQSWNKINDNYIGARERSHYNAQKILFEYGLNRNFQCSGIYINNQPILNAGMLIGNTGPYSTPISNSSYPYSSAYLNNHFSGITNTCYTIFVPGIVYSGLAATNTERENIVRNYADNYNIAGMIYAVVPY